jgi:hypothetical protein
VQFIGSRRGVFTTISGYSETHRNAAAIALPGVLARYVLL